MALASSELFGALLAPQTFGLSLTDWSFGECQGRIIVTVSDASLVMDRATKAGVVAQVIGHTKRGGVGIDQVFALPIPDLRAANERFFREWMEG